MTGSSILLNVNCKNPQMTIDESKETSFVIIVQSTEAVMLGSSECK
jgi:hypothetical protein